MDPGHLRHDAVLGPRRGALVQRAPGRPACAGRHLDVRRRRHAYPAIGAGGADGSNGDRRQRVGDRDLDGAARYGATPSAEAVYRCWQAEREERVTVELALRETQAGLEDLLAEAEAIAFLLKRGRVEGP